MYFRSNKMKLTIRLFLIVTAILLSVNFLSAQFRRCTTWINVVGQKSDTKPILMTFGVDTAATYGIDSLLGESEAPPLPPVGVLDARWIDPRFNQGISGVNYFLGGLYLLDLRKYTGSAQVDTFDLSFAPDTQFVTLRWADSSSLVKGGATSMILQDGNGPGQYYNIDMLGVDSLQVTKSKVKDVLIIRTGEKLISGVQRVSRVVPGGFALQQNYPNPFNPTTTIEFAIARNVMAEIAVYDVIGRKVATLVSGQLNPGTYTTQWNGKDSRGIEMGSGVYMARMTARTTDASGNQEFSAVRKLLLMK